ncbi:hypothetical protein WR25_15580 [Diploscapter pachys]|uniref:G-protein coupled receptors family 1 profile domain-containing protein n=1 Tax=Diploscapter pachys TaxID=2018661 RepID=A0A2A2LB13_9BILA|nr:hypothetical protein WR25_15580 [Diploscapter pachys]
MLFYANLHSLMLVLSQPNHILRSYVFDFKCEPEYSTKLCLFILIPVVTSGIGLGSTQQALWVERLLASIFLTKYENWGGKPGIILAIVTATISTVATLVMYLDLSRDEKVANCLQIPDNKNAIFTNFAYLFICFNLFAVLSNGILCLWNKYREKKSRFIISRRYQNFENFTTTKWIGIISFIQSAFLIVYSTLAYLLKTRESQFDKVTTMILWASSYVSLYAHITECSID